MKLDQKTINAIEKAGVQFAVDIDVVGGCKGIFIKAKDIPLFHRNKEAYIASYLKVPLEDYSEWLDCDGEIRCSAKTQKGTRCLNLVSGGSYYSIHAWREKYGDYCTVHGGETSEEARLGYC